MNIKVLEQIAERLGCDVEKLKEEIASIKKDDFDELFKEIERKTEPTTEEIKSYLKWRYKDCEFNAYTIDRGRNDTVFLKTKNKKDVYINVGVALSRNLEPNDLMKEHINYWKGYSLDFSYQLNSRNRTKYNYAMDNLDNFVNALEPLKSEEFKNFLNNYYNN